MNRRQTDVDKALGLLINFLEFPRNMTEIVEKMNVHRSTIYRYFEILETEGYVINCVGFRRPTKYTITHCNN